MKHSRRIRKCAKQMIKAAALVNQDTFKEVVEEKNKSITRLHLQLDRAIEEADKKVSENVVLTKELGQVKAQLREVKAQLEAAEKDNEKIRKSNVALSKEINVIQDNSIALRSEMLAYERVIIDKDKRL